MRLVSFEICQSMHRIFTITTGVILTPILTNAHTPVLNRLLAFRLKEAGKIIIHNSGVFRILILRVLSVNRIFPLRVLTAGAISLFLNITGAIAPVAPVLNTPLNIILVLHSDSKSGIKSHTFFVVLLSGRKFNI